VARPRARHPRRPTKVTTRPGSGAPPSARGRGVVWVAIAGVLFFLIPLGLVMLWLAVTPGDGDRDTVDRLVVGGLGILLTAMMAGAGVGTLRYNVLGVPAVRMETTGLRIGDRRLFWADLRDVGVISVYRIPYLMLDIEPSARKTLSLEARISTWLTPPFPDGRRPLWVTEQMLGTTVEAALEAIAPMLARPPTRADSEPSEVQ
jgi:hypothetical protein